MKKESWGQKVKDFGLLLFDTVNDFLNDKCLKKSASLAYYTVFSIGPLILILIWALGFFYGSQLDSPTGARDEIMEELNQLFGKDIALMLDAAIKRISFESKNSIGVYVGVGALVFSSTTIFVDIQNSINEIWRVKAKPKKGWLKIIVDRLLSFSMIIGLGFLLMTSLILSSIISILMNYVGKYFPQLDVHLLSLVNSGVSFLVVAVLFGFVFAVLPDAKIRFRDIFWGSIFTTLLFLLGKSLISYYLTNNATASSYGAAGSVIILLAFVYYAAAILYFGAEFTKRYAIKYGRGIRPKSYAVLVKQTELEIDPETGMREVVHKNEDIQ
ncbi:membrane protein [Sphingobacterium allocomposti]|jgi:membrane protein|uniref:Membrane protein n=1 Tax=Sphingobacterium allocomposti TaxID=415956 RepID=A0A5S5CY63_9SPHI|nr:YihY/virulence factor BrkB family protein [Sphingobacterium composti Yoo et al. 2007 non Ten et al. 2007]TYP88717.1 membrane protein [Sphingobacterium composti Yoo et al. 2007 non Ten et al. 2007]HLS94776.1 YihY/virulence factor BrkB family protein [Sphingobacterium sp.]